MLKVMNTLELEDNNTAYDQKFWNCSTLFQRKYKNFVTSDGLNKVKMEVFKETLKGHEPNKEKYMVMSWC